ncbi:flocculation protein FLO11 isoform X2 [Drosophila rhopaloa]|uniref:Flocculation protein FLO11 isoform X2 n=1 Tax=Drosophila rhopaloa TaxID=1041015 RepID=A0A6P4EMX3_DRORH|nr:flocculation protein FLO11 isoform X2 [Drosophila rhopaloa]
MAERNLLAILLLASICMAQAYPALLPYIYNPSKRSSSDTVFPQIEDDVSELDHLRNEPGMVVAKRQNDGSTARTTTTTKESVEEVAAAPEPGQNTNANILPDLERQLEVATPLISTTTTTSTSATTTTATSKEEGERSQLEEPKTQIKPVVEPTAHAKAFYGAARLAFGQNPEVLPTTTTTSTTSTTTTTTAAPPAEPEPQDESQVPAETEAKEDGAESEADTAPDVAGEPVEADDPAGEVAETELTALNPPKPKHESNKETIGDIVFDVVARTTERRSSTSKITAKTAKNLLRSPNGQYSSFDMAQYIFWTGDETAVVKAVEELVEGKVITRESALKFLQDIRLGIEFLQRSYANRIFPEEVRQNQLKRHSPPVTTPPTTSTTSTTTTTTSTTTEKPFPEVHESGFESGNAGGAVILPAKNFDSFTFWNKLKVLDSEAQQDLNDYDEGRAKIVEYLYNEYSLEEILYKLAKVMFAQSLSHGSDEAQMELQKLTEFLEREGNMGVIPIDLQKKVLRVLLSALSDTLTEHPELLPAARVNLANPFYRLPMHTPSQ